MTSPQAALNRRRMRDEARDRRAVLRAILTALCLAAALVTLARMGLQLALDLDDIIAAAAARAAM